MRRVYQFLFALFILGLSCNVEVLDRFWPGYFAFSVTEGATVYPSSGIFYDFGNSNDSATFTVENKTVESIQIFSIDLVNPANGFAISGAPSLPYTLPGFGTVTFDVDYTDNGGGRETQVQISSDASAPYRLGVSGGVRELNLAYGNSEISGYRIGSQGYDFGQMTADANPTITFTNNEKYPITITSVTETNDPDNRFTFDDTGTAGTLAPGEATSFDLTYTHSAAPDNFFKGLLEINTSVPGRTGKLYLTASNIPYPSDIASGPPVMWLDASKITSLADDAGIDRVTSWVDRSGNGWTPSNSLGSSPEYDETGLNGEPAVDFTSETQFLRTADKGLTLMIDGTANPDMTLFLVLRTPAAMTANRYLVDASRTNLGDYGFPRVRQQSTRRLQVFKYNNQRDSLNNSAMSDTTPYVFATIMENGASTADRLTLYLNGVSQTANSGGNSTSLNSITYINIGADVNGTDGFGGKLGEVILYDEALTDAERIQVENYLNLKYNDIY